MGTGNDVWGGGGVVRGILFEFYFGIPTSAVVTQHGPSAVIRK